MAASDAQIKITADTSQAERDIKKLERAIQNIEKVGDGAATALAGITAAAAAMGYAILKTLDSAGELIDTANNLGIAAQSLQGLQQAAALTGVSADQLNTALYKLNQNVGTALTQGAGGATDALKALGIPVREIAAMKVDKQFEVLATKLNEMKDPAERTALAMELFGKQGPKILSMVENLAAAKKQMEELGLALSDIDVAALDAAGDSVDELKGIFDSALKKAVADIAPYIIAIVESIKDAIKEAGGFEVVWGKIKDAITVALNIAIFTAVIFALARMATFAVGLATAIRTAGVAMGIFNAIVMRNPLMLAVGAALVLAKVLGLDVTGAMSEYLGLSKGVENANKSIAEKAEVIRQKNAEQVKLSEKLNALQEKALKAFEDQISKLEDSLQYEKEKVALGETQANINKMLNEEGRKLAEVGQAITQDQKNRITNAYTELETTKKMSAELERQKSTVKSLANAYKSEYEKALEDSVDANNYYSTMLAKESNARAALAKINSGKLSSAEIQAQEDIMKANRLTIQDYIDGVRGKAQADYQYSKAAIGITGGTAAAEEWAIEEKYSKLRTELRNQEQRLRREGHIEGNQLVNVLANQEYAKELELYALRVKLSNDLINQRAQGWAMLMSQNDAYYLKTIAGEKAVQEAGKQRAEFEAKTLYEKTQLGIEQGAQMFSALGAQNKKAFEAAKALNIASALMSTYASVTKALAAYPWPFSLIPAGAALAMGMAQVAQIRSQTYSGRALGGPVMGGTPYLVGENGPEVFTPNTTGSITRNQDIAGASPVNINFNIQANDAQGFDDLLIQRRGMVTQMVRDAMAESGQRSRM